MTITSGFWSGRRVFLTGHTGFKGAWLSLMLARLDARVTGYALDPAPGPQLFDIAGVGDTLRDVRGDLADQARLATALAAADPEIIIHMAAQPLVLEGYRTPVGTFRTNVMGTVNLLEAARAAPRLRVVLVVTTDKCYANTESEAGYRESDRLGGHDPYSASKACAELVAACYRASFLAADGVALASVRAGNVIGGGDFAADRIVPDAARALARGASLAVRAPGAVRPWQHVLDPLLAYLLVAERAYADPSLARAWNIGPGRDAERDVATILTRLGELWGPTFRWHRDGLVYPKETKVLRLDTADVRETLGWTPVFDFDTMLAWTADWYRAHADGAQMRGPTLDQVDAFLGQRVRVTWPAPLARADRAPAKSDAAA